MSKVCFLTNGTGKRLADVTRRTARQKNKSTGGLVTKKAVDHVKVSRVDATNMKGPSSSDLDEPSGLSYAVVPELPGENDTGPYHLPSTAIAQNFLSALFDNGDMLGIACGTSFPCKSKPQGPHVPASLQPTLLQLSTVHWQWIDRLPFPEARDEMIIQSGNFEEEAFLKDIFNMQTFELSPGAKPWDPSAYSIAPEFQRKWGWLFPGFSECGTNSNKASFGL